MQRAALQSEKTATVSIDTVRIVSDEGQAMRQIWNF